MQMVYQFPWVAITYCHRLGGLNNSTLFFHIYGRLHTSPKSRCWWDWFLVEILRENLFYASPNFWWLLAIHGVPWLADASLISLSLSSHDLLLGDSVCPCVFMGPLFFFPPLGIDFIFKCIQINLIGQTQLVVENHLRWRAT